MRSTRFLRSAPLAFPRRAFSNGWSKNQPHKPRILVTGCLGQIGTELCSLLRQKYGAENVIGSDIRKAPTTILDEGPFKYVDVTNLNSISKVVVEEHVTWLIHLSSILSATGERNVPKAIELNVRGIENVLQVAKDNELRVFAPSSIAAFGPTTPAVNTPNEVVMRPTTIYGVSKVYLELLGEYYHTKFGVDFRSLRYPGILSSITPPGGGTTDYAVDIFYKLARGEKYTCFLEKDVSLPMMYMPDCLRATMMLLEADPSRLKSRSYNVGAVSFSPEELVNSIHRFAPNFQVAYEPDFRNGIALSWPRSLDDSEARKDWGWNHTFGVDEMVDDMHKEISARLSGNQ